MVGSRVRGPGEERSGMRMMEMYGLWPHAYSSQGSAASLGWASSSSSVRLYCTTASIGQYCQLSCE